MLAENYYVKYGNQKGYIMSQIGKKIINVPEGINIDLKEDLFTASKGSHTLSCDIHPQIKIIFEDSTIQVNRIDDEKKSKELHGLTRALINNIIINEIYLIFIILRTLKYISNLRFITKINNLIGGIYI